MRLKSTGPGIPDPAEIEALADYVAQLEEEMAARRYVEGVSYRVECTASGIQSWEASSDPGASHMKAEARTWGELAAVLRRQELRVVE
jgi:hypothetical protein